MWNSSPLQGGAEKMSAFAHVISFFNIHTGQKKRKFHGSLSRGPYWIVIKRLSHNNQTAPPWDHPQRAERNMRLATCSAFHQDLHGTANAERRDKTDHFCPDTFERCDHFLWLALSCIVLHGLMWASQQMSARFSVTFLSSAWIHHFKAHQWY